MNTISNAGSVRSGNADVDVDIAALAAGARARFPVLERLTYLSVCEKGIISRDTRAAVDNYLDLMEIAGASRSGHEEQVFQAREKFARLIHADPMEVAFSRNVSDGINCVANAFDWREGDNVVLTAELEHPNNLYPWRHLERRGVVLRMVEPRDGAIDAQAMIDAIDDRTRMVTAASVNFAPGTRTDLRAIGAVTRARGICFVVDAVQSAGILDLDAGADMFDCLATSTSKGLLGLYGSGFLYCRKDLAERLQPAYLSRTGVDMAAGQHSEGGLGDYRLAPGAHRFELGSYPLAGAYAANASLDMLLSIGSDVIEPHVLSLARSFAAGLSQRGLNVSVAPDSPHLSHIVTVGALGKGGHDFSDDQAINQLAAYLHQQQVAFSIRKGQLRFAFHIYNNDSDVNRVFELIDSYRG